MATNVGYAARVSRATLQNALTALAMEGLQQAAWVVDALSGEMTWVHELLRHDATIATRLYHVPEAKVHLRGVDILKLALEHPGVVNWKDLKDEVPHANPPHWRDACGEFCGRTYERVSASLVAYNGERVDYDPRPDLQRLLAFYMRQADETRAAQEEMYAPMQERLSRIAAPAPA